MRGSVYMYVYLCQIVIHITHSNHGHKKFQVLSLMTNMKSHMTKVPQCLKFLAGTRQVKRKSWD